ncbi:hypothetical protein FGO68_gene7074 [Halteria grandinella]|uniref:Uncharacterized protein n=1 Tax=Halteria grandinella TaxID=5974 RepID=A0A8J8NX98_HALGN|nr:hypothetical protein FGO68_gene7074 [Halteria grandinella]
MKELYAHIRLPQISVKSLVSDIKLSGNFTDAQIFEAIQFQVAKEVLEPLHIKNAIQFKRRGMMFDFSKTAHECLKVESSDDSKVVSIQRTLQSDASRNPYPCYVSCISSEPLPLHGIHYFEIRIKTSASNNPSLPQSLLKQVFFGLTALPSPLTSCQPPKLEDPHRWKSAVLLNCYDSSFWAAGQQTQLYQSKLVKIKQPLDNRDVIRVAVDLRLAGDMLKMIRDHSSELLQGLEPQIGSPSRENWRRDYAEEHFLSSMSLRARLRDRLMRGGLSSGHDGSETMDRVLQNLGLFMLPDEPYISYQAPCKMHFAFNNSDFNEGMNLNLLQMILDSKNTFPTQNKQKLNNIPLHLVVSILEPGIQVEVSKGSVYFDEWEMIPKEPFMFRE